jgi:hypothetical protein
MADRGTLEKLTVLAYTKADYSGDPVGRFEAYVNPAELTTSYEMEYDSAQGSGTTASRMNFKSVKPGEISIAFFLDGTGASGRPLDVQQAVTSFQTVTGYNGDIHRPNYLKLMWGTVLIKRCVLKNASMNYKLFQPDGSPTRAVITATFIENSDDKTRVAKAQDHSPDLTHRRVFQAGDTLARLCQEVYGDPGLYLKVAVANGLDDVRGVKPGTAVFFPPLES